MSFILPLLAGLGGGALGGLLTGGAGGNGNGPVTTQGGVFVGGGGPRGIRVLASFDPTTGAFRITGAAPRRRKHGPRKTKAQSEMERTVLKIADRIADGIGIQVTSMMNNLGRNNSPAVVRVE